MSDIDYIIETALAHQRAGNLSEAAGIYNKVLEIEPKQPDAIHLLGMIAFANQDNEEAERLINEAILLNATIADYHLNISSVYLRLNKNALAKSHIKTAIRLAPEMSEAHYNLGNILFAEGNIDQSIKVFKRALDLDSNNQAIWANYLFALNFSKKASPKEVFKINRKWASLLEDRIRTKPRFQNKKTTRRRLKLGYYLPELDRHVTVRYLTPILAAHNKVKFELVGYGNRADNKAPPSDILDIFDRWIDISEFEAVKIAEIMRSDQIDILLHPCTFKSRYRNVLAYRAAPVQVACINLVSTTGLVAADYLITDNYVSPAKSGESLYTEKLIRLSSFNTYKQFEGLNKIDPLPALKNGFITFGSFNNIAKINSDVINTWARILKKVPNSRLVLKNGAFDSSCQREYITSVFSKVNISGEQLEFSGFTPSREDYLGVYNKIDIALDPFPFGGGTVSYEALWMGVPVLTISGRNIMGRLSGSLMHKLGLKDWVTGSKEQYISAAVFMASDIANLSKLRQNLRIKAQDTIFNAEKFTLEFEDALEEVWKDYII